ncbi:endo-alpha-1,4-polygalactosaminidase (GH114 family) [Aneurinibacillus soli]|uniref:Glycoside-hydrolase family GH114 TIM-barrel domain-containing protein n=1 Tax=Aneurinibacillus soli TaxID=1500254 RepID=A0A0U4WN74_9BACL|nr:endo alpha-1,4 polygalactosaminidase [Aneurinibacillus soli]PYE61888.1 endo-alpha-1,4-polygalactosaminidase (GH114 family) [Aneurinibacillus soli]BAU29704.1 hypothetical protein CB4_03941 [Aneurinibacillus soli]
MMKKLFHHFSHPFIKHKKTNPLSQVKSFQIYYGHVDAQALNVLKTVDLVIIEPRNIDFHFVQQIRASGTLVFGYLSIMETPTWNRDRFDLLDGSDFLMIEGEKMHFPAWNSYLMDLRKIHYQGLLLQEMKTQIIQKNMDGIFLDTIGDIEEYIRKGSIQQEMNQAYLNLLAKIGTIHPHLSLIQNRGFALLQGTKHFLDGFLWEDWRSELANQDEWFKKKLQLIKKYQKKGLKIFTVSSIQEHVHTQAAKERSFVHLVRPDGYNTL